MADIKKISARGPRARNVEPERRPSRQTGLKRGDTYATTGGKRHDCSYAKPKYRLRL